MVVGEVGGGIIWKYIKGTEIGSFFFVMWLCEGGCGGGAAYGEALLFCWGGAVFCPLRLMIICV